ncbi:hypothetical protein F2P81_018708 [Scophthalmus maximus]|uniref:Uncharacterized protein n=1 Tax=Scophthalmus maximus TaxID=52904 RepID=A0A6A4S5F0_SCOMX|nr:hypothetical protein F2P81_018708 [Scophthalmus maximus]
MRKLNGSRRMSHGTNTAAVYDSREMIDAQVHRSVRVIVSDCGHGSKKHKLTVGRKTFSPIIRFSRREALLPWLLEQVFGPFKPLLRLFVVTLVLHFTDEALIPLGLCPLFLLHSVEVLFQRDTSNSTDYMVQD